MDTKNELVAILARLDQLSSCEEHVGHCDTAELLASLADHAEQVLGILAAGKRMLRVDGSESVLCASGRGCPLAATRARRADESLQAVK
jgi:hypothetical protein